MTGGEIVAATLARHDVGHLFTLCGGHISPILVESKRLGVRVVDVRHEVDAVFAADALARLSGRPGVAAVTAGPGTTNTVTAIKNAQMAQSPVVLLGGATATILEGRGSLQDIDQMALFRPHVKWLASARTLRDLGPALEEALRVCRDGVPGPVFLECPADLLYEESIVRQQYGVDRAARGLGQRLLAFYLERHLARLFRGGGKVPSGAAPASPRVSAPSMRSVRRASRWLAGARRPLLLVGSQAMIEARESHATAAAVRELGIPTYLSGMARGLLGRDDDLQMRHGRRQALKSADLVILAGVACDFRLDYGRQFGHQTRVISANRSRRDLRLNRRPELGLVCDGGSFLRALATLRGQASSGWSEWRTELRASDEAREGAIDQRIRTDGKGVDPLLFFRELEGLLSEDSILVADGGDFVATASYTLRPRSPLSWLDPGAFGTLGVGGGFALGARLHRPESEVWILYGDGSAAYSLAEFDTFVRHRLPVIAVVGNDASWAQIAREQVPMLGDAVGTELRRSDYHVVAQGYGGKGLLLNDPSRIAETLREAKTMASEGHAVLVNVHLSQSDFRQGSLSM